MRKKFIHGPGTGLGPEPTAPILLHSWCLVAEPLEEPMPHEGNRGNNHKESAEARSGRKNTSVATVATQSRHEQTPITIQVYELTHRHESMIPMLSMLFRTTAGKTNDVPIGF